MRTKTHLGIAVALFIAQVAIGQAKLSLRAEASWVRADAKESTQLPGRLVLFVRTYIDNDGTETAIVPTHATVGYVHSKGITGISYRVGYVHRGQVRITPPPGSFLPLDLRPGERAELPEYRTEVDPAILPSTMTILFDVEQSYAERVGFWSGTLQTTIEVKAAEPGATDNPDDEQRLREDH